MTIAELQKQRIILKRTDPVRSSVYSSILDSAKKEAKKDNRDTTDADILLACKRGAKSLAKAISDEEFIAAYNKNKLDIETLSSDLYYESAHLENMLFDTERYISGVEAEIAIYEEFLPKMASVEIIQAKIDLIVSTLKEEERNSKSMGRVIGAVKKEFGDAVDMALASGMIKKALA